MKDKLVLTLIATGFLWFGLAACGGDAEPTPAGSPGDVWATVTDPLNGNMFRCFTIGRWYTGAGGPAMFCYELDTEVYGG